MKSFTTIEQSQELAKFLPEETADMVYVTTGYSMRALPKEDEDANTYPKVYPCWSLAALLDILPILERKGYQKAKPRLLYNVAINKWIVDSHVYTTDAYDNPVDTCVEMIIKLHEQNIL